MKDIARLLVRPAFAAALVLAACNAEPSAPAGHEVLPPTPPAPAEVVRPTSVDTLALGLREHALPAALAHDAALSVATLDGVGTLVGGSGGLHRLDMDGFSEVDPKPVVGLAAVKGSGIVVAHADELLVWNGTLARSSLSDALAGRTITALSARGDALWIGTDADLFVFDGAELWSFAALAGVTRVATSLGASEAVLTGADRALTAVKVDATTTSTTYAVQPLDAEMRGGSAVPSADRRLYALEAGVLTARVPAGAGKVAWRGVALTTDANAAGAKDVEALAVDPQTGAVWAATASTLAKLDGTHVVTVTRPASMSTVIAATVTLDGALWLSDGTTLRRFGDDAPPLSWASDVAPFSRANCERCHAPLKIAHPLDTYEAWSSEVDRIVRAIEEGRMPQDGVPLVGGTVDLIKTWRAGGLRP